MWEPTRLNFGEGRRFLDEMSDVIQESHRGSGVGMHAHGEHTQHGKPRRVVARDHQPDSREGQAGPVGVAEGPVVCAGQRMDQEG
jgi:hypothetical protein